MIYNPKIELVRAALNSGHKFETEDEAPLTDPQKLTKAAVLIAITNQKEPRIILTQRPQWLRSHAGQVAFPGGKMDQDDRDICHTALREAHEELAIEDQHVDIIATCSEYCTGSGYRITPIVAVVPDDIQIRPSPDEVDSWFSAPISFLFDPNNLQKKSAIWNGKERSYYDMQWHDYRIWGVTAGIIANIARKVKEYQNGQ